MYIDMATGTSQLTSQRSCRFLYYYLTLDETSQGRYSEKLSMLGGIDDLYITLDNAAVREQGLEWQDWPNLLYPDIYNYLMEAPSVYTKKEIKAYKSLEGYKYFVDGWVSDIIVLSVLPSPNLCLVSCKVKHSQRLSTEPLRPWVAVEKDSLVVCGHCNCVAGLGEACSHISALLFTLDANSQVKKSMSCTSLPCSDIQNCSFRKNM